LPFKHRGRVFRVLRLLFIMLDFFSERCRKSIVPPRCRRVSGVRRFCDLGVSEDKLTRKSIFLLILVLFLFSLYSPGQQWVGILTPSRAINWSGAGIPGGVPTRTTICQTLSPGATTTQINAAIQSCPSGQVVFLKAGVYNLTGITFNGKSNITLRGAGADQTILHFTGPAACGGAVADSDICIANMDWTFYPNSAARHAANWTSGYAKGATSITLSSTTGLQVGQLMVLQQLNDSNVDTGNIWICSTVAICSGEGGIQDFSTGGNREQMQTVRVAAISGNNVTISPGLYMPNWRSSQSPGAFWGASLPVTGDGVEDMTLDHTSTGTNAQAGITFYGAYQCWAKGVKSVKSNRGHVWMFVSMNNVVRDSYFYGTQNSASESYGIETDLSADNLIENNIYEQVAGALTQGTGTSGTVFAYNFEINDGFLNPGTWLQPESIMHASGTHMLLFEGNQGEGLEGDDFHGASVFITSFRERNLGWDSGRNNNTFAVEISALNRYWNVIGNVLGQPGYHTAYLAGPNASIYNLGNPYGSLALPIDSLTVTSLMRWGNYDVVTGTARFVSTEVPSGLAMYANPVPASQNLPASFYLSGKPVWWPANTPWPAIGPDVTGGPGPGGHAYNIPAAVCYANTSKTNGILNFNAGNCYSSTAVKPAPPTGVKVNVKPSAPK
jgi:hypothetical protein